VPLAVVEFPIDFIAFDGFVLQEYPVTNGNGLKGHYIFQNKK